MGRDAAARFCYSLNAAWFELSSGGGPVVAGKHLFRGAQRMRRFLQDAGIPESLPVQGALFAQRHVVQLRDARDRIDARAGDLAAGQGEVIRRAGWGVEV